MLHYLKTTPETFQPIWDGIRKFDIRVDDQNFKLQDLLLLREIKNGFAGGYTGRLAVCLVTYIYKLDKQIHPLSIMSIDLIEKREHFNPEREQHEAKIK